MVYYGLKPHWSKELPPRGNSGDGRRLRQVLALMPMDHSVLHALRQWPHMSWWWEPIPGTGCKGEQMWQMCELINGTKLSPQPSGLFPHDLSALAHLDHPETTVHFWNQMFPRESWLLFLSCSLRLSQSNVLRLWWRNKRKIPSLRCCGESHSGTENTESADTRSLYYGCLNSEHRWNILDRPIRIQVTSL